MLNLKNYFLSRAYCLPTEENLKKECGKKYLETSDSVYLIRAIETQFCSVVPFYHFFMFLFVFITFCSHTIIHSENGVVYMVLFCHQKSSKNSVLIFTSNSPSPILFIVFFFFIKCFCIWI